MRGVFVPAGTRGNPRGTVSGASRAGLTWRLRPAAGATWRRRSAPSAETLNYTCGQAGAGNFSLLGSGTFVNSENPELWSPGCSCGESSGRGARPPAPEPQGWSEGGALWPGGLDPGAPHPSRPHLHLHPFGYPGERGWPGGIGEILYSWNDGVRRPTILNFESTWWEFSESSWI